MTTSASNEVIKGNYDHNVQNIICQGETNHMIDNILHFKYGFINIDDYIGDPERCHNLLD